MDNNGSPKSWTKLAFLNRNDQYRPIDMYNDNRSYTDYEDSIYPDRNQFFLDGESVNQSVVSSLRGISRDSFCMSTAHIAEDPLELLECGGINDEEQESYYPEVEPVQRTVDSAGAVSVDTQDSGLFKDSPLPCGNIQFWSESMDPTDFQSKKHYVCVPTDTSVEDLADFMGLFWRMRSPKIVLSVVSGIKHFKGWKNPKLKEQFQKGIIKAANTTELWIITNGVDGGIAKTIGDAIHEEKIHRISNRVQQAYASIHAEQCHRLPKLTVIGIMPKHCISYESSFDGLYDGPIVIKNEGHKPNSDCYDLNPDHTHLILVEDEVGERSIFTHFRCLLEYRLGSELGRPHRFKRFFSNESFEMEMQTETPAASVPVVGLLVQGGPKSIDHILFFLKNKMPVLVLKGIGGAADLVAYTYEELQERSDQDFTDNSLKPELIKRISKTFPDDFKENDIARNAFRDKILECVKYSQEGEQTFLTFVNTKGWDSNLKDLDKYILKALFRSKILSGSQWREQLYKDLQLTLDWNRPDLACSEIFQREEFGKLKIDKNLFDQSLQRKDREDFVELFLDQNFQVHKFLNHKKLKLLFEKAEEREFFYTTCLEGALGKNFQSRDQPLAANFLDTDLNRLIYKLCGIKDFVQPCELSMNSLGLYVLDPVVAERKAINCLIVWAVLMNRNKLAKLLWGRSDDPIPIALICSDIYKRMATFSMELYQRCEMEQNASEFGKMALGTLDISFRDSSAQAYSMLSRPLPDFNNKTAIEIAHDSGYLHFIAHPCCQKWLTKKLFGSIQVKELDWGVFRLPYWFKILASVFLVLPMYIWIAFVPSCTNQSKLKVDIYLRGKSIFYISLNYNCNVMSVEIFFSIYFQNGKRSVGARLRTALRRKRKLKLPFWRQIYLLWNSPITKFWMTQVFYFIYLGIFSLAVLWPTCGNILLDLIVWLWTLVIVTEIARRTYIKHQKYKALSLLGHCVEIILILVFLILYLILRIIPNWVNFSDFITAKIVMAIGLIYFFYRLLGVYLPISPTLGPNLVRIVRMVKHDFVAFIRMFLIFLLAGGVTTQAVLYPNYPLGTQMLKNVLTRPLFALFLTQIQDLDGFKDCTPLYKNISPSYCTTRKTSSPFVSDAGIAAVATCPYSSLGGYIVVLQYLIICKLILTTILFAMFALTISKVDNEASSIWKFQRYALVVDFEERLCFPPPLTFLSYFAMLIRLIYRKMKKCKRNCEFFCKCWKKSALPEASSSSHRASQRLKRSEDYSYWKKCAKEYSLTLETQQKMSEFPKKQAEIVNNLKDDMQLQKKNIKRLSDRVVELERALQTSRIYLEDIKHMLDKSDVQGVSSTKGQSLHVASRQSPYPGTKLARFPVFDKYVPWESIYDVYDPKTYTKPKDQFLEYEIVFVDEDIFELRALEELRAQMPEEERVEQPALPNFRPMWNAVVTYRQGNATREVDRRSWITIDSQPVRYKLDPSGVPQNPMGRTGIRGKGSLWRWGPNHVIRGVVTRWRRKYTTDFQPTNYLYVDGKRVLEFIAVRKEDADEYLFCLPGDALHGLTSPYSTMCEAFMKSVFDEHDVDSKTELDQTDMIQFYAQFATSTHCPRSSASLSSPSRSTSQTMLPMLSGSRTSLRTEQDNQGFSACLLYKGYVDDPRNTDNAWVEAEVWNFHYDFADTFDSRILEDASVKWKEVSPYVKLVGNEAVIVQEAARIHDAYN
ncbi:transient receptor potential cation channel subfamily M member 2 [Octopus bimaculoides]|uniref:transient receptor potential cation channel subfamily M member 2 n=1 Tax=Octopus bimaculoides TaxID=37653 RepID=UPI0022DFD65E|nr:transient receptor potential cation channel subfamily M member 2 [Octopus bimaculoides]